MAPIGESRLPPPPPFPPVPLSWVALPLIVKGPAFVAVNVTIRIAVAPALTVPTLHTTSFGLFTEIEQPAELSPASKTKVGSRLTVIATCVADPVPAPDAAVYSAFTKPFPLTRSAWGCAKSWSVAPALPALLPDTKANAEAQPPTTRRVAIESRNELRRMVCPP